jgi:L-alanine-DL-glutamate epimerase-like enolase superfamily enzyme
VRLDVREQTFRLRKPFMASYGALNERRLLSVSLHSADGLTGFGEAAPLEPYDGVSLNEASRALDRYAELLAAPGADERRLGELIEACRRADPLPQALAAIDVALWDIAAQRLGCSLAQALAEAATGANADADPASASGTQGASRLTLPTKVPVNATVTALSRDEVAEQTLAAAQAGFATIKLKVGTGDDESRVGAARAAAGPTVALRLDANGAWDVEQAVAAIGALEPLGLELVEEPVHGVAAMRLVRDQVGVPVALDETAADPDAIVAGVADAVCLKLSRCGGLSALLADGARARDCGIVVYVASTLDGPVGVAASVHAAAALHAVVGPAAAGKAPACGLATLGLFAELENPLPVTDGAIAVPLGPGIGISAH